LSAIEMREPKKAMIQTLLIIQLNFDIIGSLKAVKHLDIHHGHSEHLEVRL